MTTVAVGSLSWIEVGLTCWSGVKRKGESEIDWVKCNYRGLKELKWLPLSDQISRSCLVLRPTRQKLRLTGSQFNVIGNFCR